jgi:DNA-binding Lrp family transcriptional regulator
MNAVDEPAGSGAAPSPLAGAVARVSLAYVRDIIELSRDGGDLLTPLLFTAVLDANMAPINRDPELRLAYGGVDDSTPDELRRPVSVNAVAQSLSLPFETVRRRLRRLGRSGIIVVTPRGVYVPRAAVVSAEYKVIQGDRYERTQAFHGELRALDALPPEAPAAPPWPEPLVRAVNRMVSEYMLRTCGDLIRLTGDMLGSLILLETLLANTAHLSDAGFAAWARDPVARGAPVRNRELVDRLRLSPETLRRHVLGLESAGFCHKAPGGLLAVAPADVTASVAQLAETNLANIQRLFARVREIGVSAVWEGQALRSRGAA